MNKRRILRGCTTLAVVASGVLGFAVTAASAKPILMPTINKEIQQQTAIDKAHTFTPKGSLQPPAPPCPETGMLPSPLSNCGLPEFPATTLPYPGNMAYWGGHVQTDPHVYLVYWGWGQKGAFPSTDKCTPETITEGTVSAKLKCDPDGAGKYTADWVDQLGGTQWAGTSTQYYQTVNDSAGKPYNEYITNPSNVLAGIWADDQNSITNLPKTSSTNAPGPTNTYTDLAAEASRAAAHFHVKDLSNANFVIIQPANYSDPNSLASGYCAFHDYTYPGVEGGIYNGLTQGIAYTNMPYQLDLGTGCGENSVNSGAQGKLDGYSIVLGHEIEETITDPGAEDIIGSGTSATNLGGWYDSVDANENGDKCAWVGESLAGPPVPNTPIPGAINDIKGNRGGTFAVQSLWSNQAAEGAGYCAGAGNDLPQPVPPA